MVNIITFCFAICLLILGFYFLDTGKLTGMPFVSYIGVIIGVSLIVFFRNIIKELEIFKFRISFKEIEKVKKDIYAKAEEVRNMGEKIAEMIAENVAMESRWAGEDIVYRRIERRKKIEEMLRNLGADESLVIEKVKKVDIMVTFDLYHEVIKKAGYTTMAKKQEAWMDSLKKEILQGNKFDIDELRKNFKEEGVDLSEIEKELLDLEYFIKNRTLPLRKI